MHDEMSGSFILLLGCPGCPGWVLHGKCRSPFLRSKGVAPTPAQKLWRAWRGAGESVVAEGVQGPAATWAGAACQG